MSELTPHEGEMMEQYDELIRCIRSQNPEDWEKARTLLDSLDVTTQGTMLAHRLELLRKKDPEHAREETNRLLRAIFTDIEEKGEGDGVDAE